MAPHENTNNVTLMCATRLNRGRVASRPQTVTVPVPVTQLTENEMITLIRPGSPVGGELDETALLDAFERFGGPFGGRICFVRDGGGDVWACEVEQLAPSMTPFADFANQAPAVVGALSLAAQLHRRRRHSKSQPKMPSSCCGAESTVHGGGNGWQCGQCGRIWYAK